MNYVLRSVWLLLAVSCFLRTAAAAELTIGETAFNKAAGRDCKLIRLWPVSRIPDEPNPIDPESVITEKNGRSGYAIVSNVSRPSIMLLPAPKENNTGALFIVCPSGGYNSLYCNGAIDTAEWMNKRGINVALLKYRVPKRLNGFEWNHQPLQDAQRALGILRSRAEELGFEKNKIGITGFSAGGHLAASLAINHSQRSYQPVDEFDKISCRPDFCAMLYPAYLTNPISTRKRDSSLNYDLISAKDTPPTFVSITRQDRFAIGAVEFKLALMEGKVSSELHVYPEGDHGGGIKHYPFREWANECYRFLGDHGFVKGGPTPKPLTYKARGLPDIELSDTLTLGDQRLRQIFGVHHPVIAVWPNGTGPGVTFSGSHMETVTAKSRGGNALNIRDVIKPTLTIALPADDKGNGRAVIVCPGGAYGGLAAEHEGVRVCEWLNGLGITAILLKYRVPRPKNLPKHANALQDLQRSIRLVRSMAKELKIDKDQIGICGFSAGGHLCTTLATNHAMNSYSPVDHLDTISARPDFSMLIYPAYLTDPIDSNDVDPLLKSLDAKKTPPLFMTSARDDRFTRGMLNFFLHAREAGVSAECHVYAKGGHGGGIDPIAYPSSEWTKSCERWLKDLSKQREE